MTTTERPKHHIVNCETGEVTVRDFTDEEIEQAAQTALELAEQRAILEATEKAQAEAKASAIAKLAALGLTEEEAAAIAG